MLHAISHVEAAMDADLAAKTAARKAAEEAGAPPPSCQPNFPAKAAAPAAPAPAAPKPPAPVAAAAPAPMQDIGAALRSLTDEDCIRLVQIGLCVDNGEDIDDKCLSGGAVDEGGSGILLPSGSPHAAALAELCRQAHRGGLRAVIQIFNSVLIPNMWPAERGSACGDADGEEPALPRATICLVQARHRILSCLRIPLW